MQTHVTTPKLAIAVLTMSPNSRLPRLEGGPHAVFLAVASYAHHVRQTLTFKNALDRATTMRIDKEQLLSSLRMAEEDTSNDIVLCGRSVPVIDGQFRISVGDLCLCFALNDILKIESYVIADSGLGPASWLGIRVVIRRGAALLDISLSKVYEGLVPRRRPFALAVRPQTIKMNFRGHG